MEEIWKDLPTYEGLYQVSNLGNVKSLPRVRTTGTGFYISKEKQLKKYKDIEGYMRVCLCKNKKQNVRKVHQLVAMSFLNHIPEGMSKVIDHINDDKTDNRLENLHVVTQRFNSRKTQGSYSSKYKGVYWSENQKRWITEITINKKKLYLGSYKCELAAGLAYQNKLKEIR